jgi:tungstate transport system ATP-binding protein
MGVENAYSIRSLKHAYDGKVVLDIPYLDIPSGQICVFSGPNGSGKTTLLSILALILAPSEGSVSLNAIECGPDPDRELRRMVTLVHQKPILFSTSARNNLAYGLKTRGLSAKEIDRRIMSIADAMQISTIINKHTRKLSGGEAQRVILARALVMETPIILLDEPTNSLDDAYRPLLVESLCKTSQNFKTTVVIATHDTKFISSLSGRILRMEKGKILNSADI